jgi:hypothetical protein
MIDLRDEGIRKHQRDQIASLSTVCVVFSSKYSYYLQAVKPVALLNLYDKGSAKIGPLFSLPCCI